MGAGVGLFIGFIGLKNGGLIVPNDSTYLALGDLTDPTTLLAALGFLIIAIMSIRAVPGAILAGIIVVTSIAVGADLVQLTGVVAMPPSLGPTFMQLDILAAFDVAMISVVAAFLFVNLFDTAGTLLAVANRAGLTNDKGEIRDLDRALKADSASSILGAFVGCAPVTSYVESSAGVSAGGRSGLTAIVVGILFLLAIFMSPIAKVIPSYATAGALIYIAMLMLSGIEFFNWSDRSEVLPAMLTVVLIPLLFSIADGIAIGFITYFTIKIFTGQWQKLTPAAWLMTGLFVTKFVYI